MGSAKNKYSLVGKPYPPEHLLALLAEIKPQSLRVTKGAVYFSYLCYINDIRVNGAVSFPALSVPYSNEFMFQR
jgi:hypothetical protein